MAMPKYEEDFHGWVMVNVTLLKQGKFGEVDMDHVIEEMEALGHRNKRELVSRLAVLFCHLLKWSYQPNFQSRSWIATIAEQRYQIRMLIRDNPSLMFSVEMSVQDGYALGVIKAISETGLNKAAFPSVCSYSFEQCLEESFFPADDQDPQ